jgi:hypothetical protein
MLHKMNSFERLDLITAVIYKSANVTVEFFCLINYIMLHKRLSEVDFLDFADH